MSSSSPVSAASDSDGNQGRGGWQNPWKFAIAVLSGVRILGGVVAVTIGLVDVTHYDNTVLGQDVHLDVALETAIVRGAAIFHGVLVLGAVGWDRLH